jgi:Fe-S-cluster containining protein
MSQEKFDLPHQSPVVPNLLDGDAVIQFDCHKGIACFNECCRHADITLTPYDILRLKQQLGISTTEVLARHTVPFEMDASGMPGIKLKTQDDKPVCLFVTDEGCSVYENRPSACRYYPVGLMAMRKTGQATDEHHYCLVEESHCLGHKEQRQQTIAEYRQEQGVEIYDEMNREWYQIILKKRSSGPAVGKPSPTSFQFFFMCSYDLDRFRPFIMSDNFKSTYDLDAAVFEELQNDDVALMQFGFRLMKQVFFGEETIPLRQGVLEERVEKRKDILEQRRQAEIELHRQKDDPYRQSDV